MYNTDLPRRADLPGAARLVRSTVAAALVAVAILVSIVLPAEYAIDPTGAGRLLRLTQMGEIKMQLAAEAAAESQASAAAAANPPSALPAVAPSLPEPAPEHVAHAMTASSRSDEVRFTLTSGQGAEYKLVMRRGARARFAWSSTGGPVNFDAHGSAPGQRVSYGTGRSVTDADGELEAAFDGNHGWFFRNRTGADVTVTLRTTGDYAELKKVL